MTAMFGNVGDVMKKLKKAKSRVTLRENVPIPAILTP